MDFESEITLNTENMKQDMSPIYSSPGSARLLLRALLFLVFNKQAQLKPIWEVVGTCKTMGILLLLSEELYLLEACKLSLSSSYFTLETT